MSLFTPDRYFSRISFIDVKADLLAQGADGVLIDIDNTIRSRADNSVPSDVRLWLRRVQEAGIRVCLLSNNWHKNAHELARELDVPIVAKACKPLPHGFIMAARRIGCPHGKVTVIGDQMATDVAGAHIVGMRAYLVCPLAEEDLRHTVLLRNVERLFMNDREPEGASACETSRS